MPSHATSKAINAALLKRFGAEFEIDPELTGLDELEKIAGHRSHRRFLPRPIAPDLLRLLCACALAAPSKSDLQQCDIIIVSDAAIRKSIVSLIREMPWINDAPVFLVFAANGRRLPAISQLRGKPFPNDHLDLFFAGLCVGWPAQAGEITPRLSLRTTVIENKYGADDLAAEIDAYDRRREKLRPYQRQRDADRWGEASFYGWSEDKARQYAEPMRTDFGSFVRGKGFCLD